MKGLGKFGTRYDAVHPTKYHGSNQVSSKISQKNKKTNDWIQKSKYHKSWSTKILESDYDKKNLYQVENTSLDETKEKLNDLSVRLNTKFHMWFKIEIILYIYKITK